MGVIFDNLLSGLFLFLLGGLTFISFTEIDSAMINAFAQVCLVILAGFALTTWKREHTFKSYVEDERKAKTSTLQLIRSSIRLTRKIRLAFTVRKRSLEKSGKDYRLGDTFKNRLESCWSDLDDSLYHLEINIENNAFISKNDSFSKICEKVKKQSSTLNEKSVRFFELLFKEINTPIQANIETMDSLENELQTIEENIIELNKEVTKWGNKIKSSKK